MVKSGKYFDDARLWYFSKYLEPENQLLYVIIMFCAGALVFLMLSFYIYNLFPVVKQLEYFVSANDNYKQHIKITKANYFKNDVLKSITDIFLRNYVMKREYYNYNKLGQQLEFVKNNSTRIIFNHFKHYMSIDNPASPVMKYRDYVLRNVNIESVEYDGDNSALVQVRTTAVNNANEIIEDQLWQIYLEYEIDSLNLNKKHGSRFNFIVTRYKLKLLNDGMRL